MPKISQIDEVPCQAEVRILQKITLNILHIGGKLYILSGISGYLRKMSVIDFVFSFQKHLKLK